MSGPVNFRSKNPIGRTGAFVEAVRAVRGDAWVRSWLSPLTCQFEDCVVWTFETGRVTINAACSDLIAAHNIVIRADAESHAHYIAATDQIIAEAAARNAEKRAKSLARKEKRKARKSA